MDVGFNNSLFFKKFCSVIYIVVCSLAICVLGMHFLYVLADMVKRLMVFYSGAWSIIATTNDWVISYIAIPCLLFVYSLLLANLSVYLMRIFLRQLTKLTRLLKLKS